MSAPKPRCQAKPEQFLGALKNRPRVEVTAGSEGMTQVNRVGVLWRIPLTKLEMRWFGRR